MDKVSQIRVHYQLVGCYNSSIDHPRVARAIDGVKRNKDHVPNIKSPIQPRHFISIFLAIPADAIGKVIKGILLVLYYGALRQNKLIPRTVRSWNPAIQPTRGDCVLSTNQCQVFIKTAKNMQLNGQHRTVTMYKAHNSNICPVTIMHNIFADTPTLNDMDPLFMFPDSRDPVPSSKVLGTLHQVMYAVGLGNLVPVTTLHSVRKSTATNAFAQGFSELSIRKYGGWSSSAYQTYIKTSNATVNASLIQSIDLPQAHPTST